MKYAFSLWEESFFNTVFSDYIFPFSPFISSHLSGRVENSVRGLLLSITNVKYVPWVWSWTLYFKWILLSWVMICPDGSVSSVALALPLRWHNGGGAMAVKLKAICTVWHASLLCALPVALMMWSSNSPLLETRDHFILTWTKGVNYWKAWRS